MGAFRREVWWRTIRAMDREIRYCTTSDGVRIAYCVEGEGPQMVVTPFLIDSFALEHLSPGHESFVRRLREQFQVIRYDMRNVGSSQRGVKATGLESLALDLEAVFDAASKGPVTLFARATSGPPAMLYAARRPDAVARLVLYGTAARMLDNYSEDALKGLAQLARANWPMAARTMADFSGRRDFGDAGLQNAELYMQSTTGEDAAMLIDGVIRVDATPYLSQLRCETLVIHPMDDENWAPEGAQRVAAMIPRAVFVPVRGSFHHIAFGEP